MQNELLAVLENVGVALLEDRRFLRITGADATRWLNGMVTNSIQALEPKQGNYNFLLSAQGRIQGDCMIYREPGDEPAFLLETSADQIETIYTLLDKFIIMDEVELARTNDGDTSLLILGADTEAILRELGLPVVEPLHTTRAHLPEGDLVLLGGQLQIFPQVELRGKPAITSAVLDKALGRGAKLLTSEDMEALRILSGMPRYSVDIRERELPQETNQTQALHFAKGCYLGQEIVERIRSRGQVHRLFTAFELTGQVPPLPTPLDLDGKAAGELTSAAVVGNVTYALGYARREALDARKLLTFAGGTATPRIIKPLQSIQQLEN